MQYALMLHANENNKLPPSKIVNAFMELNDENKLKFVQ